MRSLAPFLLLLVGCGESEPTTWRALAWSALVFALLLFYFWIVDSKILAGLVKRAGAWTCAHCGRHHDGSPGPRHDLKLGSYGFWRRRDECLDPPLRPREAYYAWRG